MHLVHCTACALETPRVRVLVAAWSGWRTMGPAGECEAQLTSRGPQRLCRECHEWGVGRTASPAAALILLGDDQRRSCDRAGFATMRGAHLSTPRTRAKRADAFNPFRNCSLPVGLSCLPVSCPLVSSSCPLPWYGAPLQQSVLLPGRRSAPRLTAT